MWHVARLMGLLARVMYVAGPSCDDAHVQVRLNVLRSLHNLSDYVTLDQVSEALLPSLDELSEDKLWRVRHQLVALTPTLGQHLGMVFFQRDLLGRTLTWLTDSAAIIRTTAAESLCEVAVAFGNEWTKDHVLGRVRPCYCVCHLALGFMTCSACHLRSETHSQLWAIVHVSWKCMSTCCDCASIVQPWLSFHRAPRH